MSPNVQVVGPDDKIQAAAIQMSNGDFGLLPVAENDQLIGTLSDRDIVIRAVANGKDGSTKVREVMSEGVIWAYENESVEEGAKLMSEHQIRRLPILDVNRKLVGIVALGDFAVVSADAKAAGEALSEISKAN